MLRRGDRLSLFLQAPELSVVRRGLQQLSYREAAPILARIDVMAAVEITVPVEATAAIAATLSTERLQRWESPEAHGRWQRGG